VPHNYDNLKTVVDAIFVGKERRFNRRFLTLANHYLFEPVACMPESGWEKGQVENQVGNIREWLFTPLWPSLTILPPLTSGWQRAVLNWLDEGESLFLRKIFPGILLEKSAKITRPPMPSAAPIRPATLVSTRQGLKHSYAMT